MATINYFNLKRIRLPGCCGLILFVLVFGCSNKKSHPTITIVWEGSQAKSISIPIDAMDLTNQDSIEKYLRIRLPETEQAVLGEYSLKNDSIYFTPLLSFTKEMQYEVWLRDKKIDEFKIPRIDSLERPTLISVYPSGDQLPQNLLKIYLNFSKPMQQGQALKHIHLIKGRSDTLKMPFLDLQPELWNQQGNLLTIWFDPGRIKRDLIPNKTLGPPLIENASYSLDIDSSWMDKEGLTLTKAFSKPFRTVSRDSLSPNPINWIVNTPIAGTKGPLHLELNEALDYLLLLNTIHILDQSGRQVMGSCTPLKGETQLNFIPNEKWEKGDYVIRIESRLEDLAGNNLNRLFDRDITSDTSILNKDYFELSFIIGK